VKAWPLFMTIGNIPNRTRFVPGQHCAQLIALLPVIKGMHCIGLFLIRRSGNTSRYTRIPTLEPQSLPRNHPQCPLPDSEVHATWPANVMFGWPGTIMFSSALSIYWRHGRTMAFNMPDPPQLSEMSQTRYLFPNHFEWSWSQF
jgi:hypothetical protein